MTPKSRWWATWHGSESSARRRRTHKTRAEVECLEGRQVLSRLVEHGLGLGHDFRDAEETN